MIIFELQEKRYILYIYFINRKQTMAHKIQKQPHNQCIEQLITDWY